MTTAETTWRRLAVTTAERISIGTVLEKFRIAVPVFGALVLVAGIIWRIRGWSGVWGLPAAVGLSIILVFGAKCAMLLRRKKELIGLGFARLDSVLGLNNALSCAAAGRGDWPVITKKCDDLIGYNWKRILPPYAICLLLSVMGFVIPLPHSVIEAGKIPSPRSHEEIAALISELSKTAALNPNDLQQLEERLDEIRDQPSENWYSHRSLEAADNLQDGIEQQLRALESGLSKAASSLASLEDPGGTLNAADQQQLAGEFKAAIEGLKSGTPGLNQKLMESLSQIEPGKLKSLNSGELDSMLKKLQEASGACGNCLGSNQRGPGQAQSELDQLLGQGKGTEGGLKNGTGIDHPGRGGIQRGPGVAPLPLSPNPTDLTTNKPESLQAADLNRARPGDLIGSINTEHQLNKSITGPQTGGVSAQGLGGEAVSRDALLPSEKAILRSYFR